MKVTLKHYWIAIALIVVGVALIVIFKPGIAWATFLEEQFYFIPIILLLGYIVKAEDQSFRRLDTILELDKELSKEKEKLRLLRKLNPEPRDEDGWKFVFNTSSVCVEKHNIKGGRRTICDLIHLNEKEGRDYYGYRIAKLLNDGYVVGNPIGRNLEVKSKIERINDLLKIFPLGALEPVEFTSKVPTIKADTPMPPVKPPRKRDIIPKVGHDRKMKSLEDEIAIRKAEFEENQSRVFNFTHDQFLERFTPPKPTRKRDIIPKVGHDIDPLDNNSLGRFYDKLKTLEFLNNLELKHCAHSLCISYFSDDLHDDEIRLLITPDMLIDDKYVMRTGKTGNSGYLTTIIFYQEICECERRTFFEEKE